MHERGSIRKTKIIATLGPAVASQQKIEHLIRAGMDVARINFSHGTYTEHLFFIRAVRAAAARIHKSVGILLDVQGPKIRTGIMADPAGVLLKEGQFFYITTRRIKGTEHYIPSDYRGLVHDVRPKDIIFMDDGLIEVEVRKVNGEDIQCVVRKGGIIKDHKGMNLPGITVSTPSLTLKDKKDIAFGIAHAIDYVALSFVRCAADIVSLRKYIKRMKADVHIIAKIEKSEALSDFDSILSSADGIMIARGDLGVEMPLAQLPSLQKDLIKRANDAGKITITATQMLDSMRDNPRPTRAETTDVANAIFDGTDAVMLSGETATGRYPIETVRAMVEIIAAAEKSRYFNTYEDVYSETNNTFPFSTAHAAMTLARESHAHGVIVFSLSGQSALILSKRRPCQTILGVTPCVQSLRRMTLYNGVHPVLVDRVSDVERLITVVERKVLHERLFKKGDVVVIVAGQTNIAGGTNFLKIHCLGKMALASR